MNAPMRLPTTSTASPPNMNSIHLVLALGLAAAPLHAAQKDKQPVPAPEGVRVERDVPYLGDARHEKADLYFPSNMPVGRKLPVVIVIHGGGFNDGDKARVREVSIVSDLVFGGYVAMSINYRLWNKGVKNPTWPQSLLDAKTSVRWLRANAARLGVDGEHIGVLGGSAGGNLASMLALTRPADGFEPEAMPDVSSAVKCAVDLYGAVDLREYHDMKMFLQTREENPEIYRKASPTTYVHAGAPPMLLIHGDADTVVNVKQSETLAAALKSVGAPHELMILRGAPHSFDLQPMQRDLRPLVIGFFDKHLKAAPVRAQK